MNLQEIRVSGLLEQYVIGALSSKDQALVAASIIEYPQLKEDIAEIGAVLRAYNSLSHIPTPPELKNQVLEAYKNVAPKTTSKIISKPKPSAGKKSTKSGNHPQIPWAPILGLLAGLFAIGCLALFLLNKSKVNSYKKEIATLSSSIESKNSQIETISAERDSLSNLSAPSNLWYSLKPTYRYLDAQAYVIKNTTTNATYAKMNALPDLPEGRSHKIWIQDATGVYEQLPVSIESLSSGFMNSIDIPTKAVRLVISIHRDNTEYVPSARTIVGTIEL